MSRRFIRDRMQREAYRTPRPFNGQVYDIDSDGEYCRVVVQGGTNLVRVWFTRNGHHKPDWVRVGMPVLCQYKLGSRGEIELIGHGTVMITPMPGGYTVTIPASQDAILSGCEVVAIPPL